MCYIVTTSLQRTNIIRFRRPIPVGCIDGGGVLPYAPIYTFFSRRGMDSSQLFKLFVDTDIKLYSIAFLQCFGEKRSLNIVFFSIYFSCGFVELFCDEDVAGSSDSSSLQKKMVSRCFRFLLLVMTARTPCIPIPVKLFLELPSVLYALFSSSMENYVIIFFKSLSCCENARGINFSDLLPWE